MERAILRAHAVEVTELVATKDPHDYADAFEVQLGGPETSTPEAWVRAGLGRTPAWVKWLVRRLGARRRSAVAPPAPDFWRVSLSTPDVVQLEASTSLLRIVMVGRRVEHARRRLTTVLHFRRPWLASFVWTFLRFGHLRTAPRILTSDLEGIDAA